MRQFITIFILTFAFAFASNGLANAKIPAEVMEPYKAYAAAKAEGDEKATYQNAKKAWETAEDIMGDSKTTGDLAHNFAALYALGKNPYKNYETRLKARKRSIALAKFYPAEEIAGVEVDRRLKLAEMSLMLTIKKQAKRTSKAKTVYGGKGLYFDEVERAIEKYNMQGGVFDGDLNVLKSRFYNLRKQYEKSIVHADRALEIYAAPKDKWSSAYPAVVRMYKGDSLKAMEQPIQAALEYQSVMQNLEGLLPAEHPFIKNAFTSWIKTRSGLEDAGRLEEAEKAGLCECWPFEDYKDKVVPLQRTPPKMPSSFARGSRSGHVVVMYDVDDQGSPYNIRKVSSTSSKLDSAAINSVKGWEFTKRSPDEAENSRKDVSNRITFRLMSRSGNILPE